MVIMTATGHAIIGTIIAAKISNPVLAIPIALLSHIAADAFPHWDTATNIKTKGRKRVFIESFFDVLISFLISYLIHLFLFPQTDFFYILFIVFIAQLFDWIMALYYFFDIKLFKWAYDFQLLFDSKLDKPWGIINQIAVLTLLVVLAKIF